MSERNDVHVLEFRPGSAPAWRVWPVHLSESEAASRARGRAREVQGQGALPDEGRCGDAAVQSVRARVGFREALGLAQQELGL